MKKVSLCDKCALRHHLRLNLFKTDKTHPRIYHIDCGIAPAPGGYKKDNCVMYRKKKLKHRLGMAL